jgi:DNA-binding transcriptional ArsR family regulator
VLRQKGIVVAERDGSFVRYSLADRRILGAIDTLLDVLATQLARQGAHMTAARRMRPIRPIRGIRRTSAAG